MEDDPKGAPDALWGNSETGARRAGAEVRRPAQTLLDRDRVRGAGPCARTPAFESAVMSAGVLLAAGSDAQKKEWLPKIASGEAILTPAWLEPQSGFGPKGVNLRATKSGDGYELSGQKRHVAFASSAARLLVLARTGGAQASRSSWSIRTPGHLALQGWPPDTRHGSLRPAIAASATRAGRAGRSGTPPAGGIVVLAGCHGRRRACARDHRQCP
jgi:hypothetical protein